MSPQLLPRPYQRGFSAVISDVATTGNSGFGVFDAGRKCLLGIHESENPDCGLKLPPKMRLGPCQVFRDNIHHRRVYTH
jgi:hypothetical protein